MRSFCGPKFLQILRFLKIHRNKTCDDQLNKISFFSGFAKVLSHKNASLYSRYIHEAHVHVHVL